MLFKLSFLGIIFAGVMNGSFTVPAKFIKQLTNEKVWQYHSIFGMAILPWLLLTILSPQAVIKFSQIRFSTWLCIIFGGLIFGVGQICFARAIKKIGLSLSFATNIGIGLVIGSIFVILYKGMLFSFSGGVVVLAVMLILCGLATYYFSNKSALRLNRLEEACTHLKHGWFLAIFAGIASGLQNIVFIISISNEKPLFSHLPSFWVWPPYLLFASIPMIIGFKSKKKLANMPALSFFSILKNSFLIFLMGLFFVGSLVLYSYGVSHLSHEETIIAWPAFLIPIILTTQFWGWVFDHQYRNISTLKMISILSLVVAIAILTFQVQ